MVKQLKQDDAKQSKRFVEMARTLETSDNPKDFDRDFDKVVKGLTRSKHQAKNQK